MKFAAYGISVLVMVFAGASTALGGELAGTIIDSAGVAQEDVLVYLSNLQDSSYHDSMLADQDGRFLFAQCPVGSYRLTAVKSGFQPFDTVMILGESPADLTILLTPLSEGTFHSDTISTSTWHASESPHRISSDVTVLGDLTIEPGCIVVFESNCRILVHGSLSIGQAEDSQITVQGLGRIETDDFTGVCEIQNTNLGIASFALNSGLISLSNTGFAGTLKATRIHIHKANLTWNDLRISAQNVTIDSCRISCGYDPESASEVLTAEDSIVITNTVCTGSPSYYSGALRVPGIALNTARIFLFSSVFQNATVYLSSRAAFTARHCNLYALHVSEDDLSIDTDTITNSIIDTLWIYGTKDTLFQSPFRHNIIPAIMGTRYYKYFGLGVNIQTNVNNDSCDLFFNIKGDPQYADPTHITLSKTSPAIGAADDGSNIGFYQGDGEDVSIRTSSIKHNRITPGKPIVTFLGSRTNQNLSGSIDLTRSAVLYNLRGQAIPGGMESITESKWRADPCGIGLYVIKPATQK